MEGDVVSPLEAPLTLGSGVVGVVVTVGMMIWPETEESLDWLKMKPMGVAGNSSGKAVNGIGERGYCSSGV